MFPQLSTLDVSGGPCIYVHVHVHVHVHAHVE